MPRPSDPYFADWSYFDKQGSSELKLGFGPPPLRTEGYFWVNSVEISQQRIPLKANAKSETLELQSQSYTSMLKKEWSENWSSSAFVFVSSRKTKEAFAFPHESFFLGGLLLVEKKIEALPGWNVSFGAVFPGRSSSLSVLPALGFEYESANERHEIELAFPVSQYTYRFTDKQRWGLSASYDSESYFLQKENFSKKNVAYVQQRRLLFNTFWKMRLYRVLWWNVSLGYTPLSDTKLQDENFSTKDRLAKQEGVNFSTGVSLGFD